MSGYSNFEQVIGGFLDRYPRIKRSIETSYQRASYHIFADTNFEYDLHNGVTIQSVASWAGADDHSHQFVGFYDVSPWNKSMSKYFVHEIDGDEALIRVYSGGDVETKARTTAWNYQQGSRTQWHPTRDDMLLFNDVDGETAVAKLVDMRGEIHERYDYPIQAVSPTGNEFVSVNYRRLDRNSPGYGYSLDDGSPFTDPATDGLFRIKFEKSDKAELLVSFADLIEHSNANVSKDLHYIHHALYSPDGNQLVFLHRWIDNGKRQTRFCHINKNGKWKVIFKNPYISHFSWLDNERLFLWGGSDEFGRGYHVLNVMSGELIFVDALSGYGDGHPSVSPDGNWIVTDSYPDRTRKRSLTLYSFNTRKITHLGEFFAPFGYDGTTRCDLHPRWSPDGRFISIDSVHEGVRKNYIINVVELMSGDKLYDSVN